MRVLFSGKELAVLDKPPNLAHPHPFVEAIRVGVFAINAQADSKLSSAIELAENVLQERCTDTSIPPWSDGA